MNAHSSMLTSYSTPVLHLVVDEAKGEGVKSLGSPRTELQWVTLRNVIEISVEDS